MIGLPAMARSQAYQLATPRIVADSVFFKQSAKVQLELDLENTAINYTLDGELPLENAPVYQKPLVVRQSTTVRGRAMHPDFIPSTFAEKQLFQIVSAPDSVQLNSVPDTTYRGGGQTSLFDLQKGTRDTRDGRWLGFRLDTVVVLEVFFKKPVMNKRLMVSTLFDSNAWIFPPAAIEVLGAEAGKDLKPMGVWSAKTGSEWKDRPARYDLYQRVVLRPVAVDRMLIRIIPFGPLPEGHAGAGQPAWLFLDEIFFQ